MEHGNIIKGLNMERASKEIDKHELASYRPWLTMECYSKDPDVFRRKDAAWNLARDITELLKRKYGAVSVVVFGSLVRETGFTPWSDIDMAVWGIAAEDFYQAAGEAIEKGLEEGIRVDIVDPVVDCGPEFLKDIEKEGIEL